MSDTKLSRREFLLGGASALLAAERAQAFRLAPPTHQLQKGWIKISPTSSIGARSQAMTRTMGNYIFIFGGLNASNSYPSTASWFDPTNNLWVPITATGGPAGRANTTIATNGTHLFFWGGNTAGGRIQTGGLFTPTSAGSATGTWTIPPTASPNLSIREYPAIVWCNGKYLVWGGRNGSTYYNDGAIYDPVANTWTAMPASPAGVRALHVGVSTGTKMLIYGGYNGSAALDDGFVYDAVAGTWASLPSGPFVGAGNGIAMASLWTGTEMFLFGGGGGGAAFYNPSTSSWRLVASSPVVGGADTKCYLNGSKIMVAEVYNNCGFYDTAANTWTLFPTTNGPSSSPTQFVVGYANRRLMVWGGTIGTTRQNNGVMYWHPAYF